MNPGQPSCKGGCNPENEDAPLTSTAKRLGNVLLEYSLTSKSPVCEIGLSVLGRALALDLRPQALNSLLAELVELRTRSAEYGPASPRLLASHSISDDGKTLTYQLSKATLQALQEFYRGKGKQGLAVGADEPIPLPGDLDKLPPPSAQEIEWGLTDPDMYYFRRELLSRGFDVPLPLSFDQALPLLIRAGMARGRYTDINIKRQNIIWRDLEADEGELRESEIVAGDDYVGTVSFRAEAKDDYLQLQQLLQNRYSKVVTYEIEDETGFQLVIARPLTIRKLYNQMLKVIDGHCMYDTLRALPLNQNCLERRMYEPEYPPEDWADNSAD